MAPTTESHHEQTKIQL